MQDTFAEVQCYLGLAEYYRLTSENKNALVHLEKATGLLNAKMKGYSEALAGVFYIKGKILAGQGNYRDALRFIRIASETNGTINPQKNARYLNYIGNIYNLLGDNDSAEHYFNESFEQINSVTEGPSIEKAWYYLNMSQIYNRRGEYDKALDNLRRNIQISIKLYGEDFPDLMNSYLNLGYYYITAGLPDTAIFYLDKAEILIYKDSISGSTLIPSLYECRGLLGYSYGDYPQALKAYQQALEIALQVYGPTHPILYRYYNNCANTYCVTW